jgi:hypothetical protein
MPFITCPAVWLLAKNTRLGVLLTLGPFIAVPLAGITFDNQQNT